MNQVIGNSRPVRVGKRVYLISYVSVAEWQTFDALQKSSGNKSGILYLLYSALHRADSRITKLKVKWLFWRYQKYVGLLVDVICDISMPKMKGKQSHSPVSPEENERNTKTMYRLLGKLYGWTPEVVSNMSPAQIYIYLTGGAEGTGIVKMTNAEYQGFRATRAAMNVRN